MDEPTTRTISAAVTELLVLELMTTVRLSFLFMPAS